MKKMGLKKFMQHRNKQLQNLAFIKYLIDGEIILTRYQLFDIELRGFAPIWNIWNNGLTRNKKIKYNFSAFGSHDYIISPLHYSMCEAK